MSEADNKAPAEPLPQAPRDAAPPTAPTADAAPAAAAAPALAPTLAPAEEPPPSAAAEEAPAPAPSPSPSPSPAPVEEAPAPPAVAEDAAVVAGDAVPQGLSWSWEFDFEALLTALTEPAPWNRPVRLAPPASPAADEDAALAAASPPAPDSAAALASDSDMASAADTGSGSAAGSGAGAAEADPVEAEFAEMLAAIEATGSQPLPVAVVAGRVTESLPPGPDLAAWLSTGEVAGLEDGALAGMATSYRRLASWAQAGELAVIAQLAARSAAADPQADPGPDGRPDRLTGDACAQVSLALTMSHTAASWWADLAVTLTWRLPATGAALRAGQIDLARARLIAEATAGLDEDTARAVETRVLPRAGDQTTGQLRAALRRAVITADPRGAERRREEAERRAAVRLYPDPDGTAALAGSSLPAVRAAAAMARITALAQAMKAAGAGGGIDLLRAHVFIGLLLGTLPYIPPADGAPPDTPPDDPDDPPGQPGDDQPDNPPGEPGDDQPGGPAGDRPPEPSPPPRPAGLAPDDPSASGDAPGHRATGHQRPPRSVAGPRTENPGPVPPGTSHRQRGRPPPGPDRAAPPDPAPDQPAPAPPGCGPAPPGCGPAPPGPDPGPGPGPAPPDEEDPGPAGLSLSDGWVGPADHGDPPASLGLPPAWPEVLPVLPPGPAALASLRPAPGGLLDLTVPWSTLAGDSGEPGYLTRIGPITPDQARHLADLAAHDPAVPWRVILTSSDGRAIAVRRIARPLAGPGGQASLIRQASVTISAQQLTNPAGPGLPIMYQRTLRAAAQAAGNAYLQASADTAAGGCAHALASPAYTPPPRLRDFITVRDGTCRFPTCRQPVWRCDLDHSIPHHRGGKTCPCNLGGLCRFHHQLKQHLLWQLTQPAPGTFAWTTPAGRTYYTQPDQHAA